MLRRCGIFILSMILLLAAGDSFAKGKADDLTKNLNAAVMGDAAAQFNLGLMYEKGIEVDKDYKEAARWYRKAADQGYAKAQTNLAGCYKRGRGVEKNLTKALEWYLKAAKHGDTLAMNN